MCRCRNLPGMETEDVSFTMTRGVAIGMLALPSLFLLTVMLGLGLMFGRGPVDYQRLAAHAEHDCCRPRGHLGSAGGPAASGPPGPRTWGDSWCQATDALDRGRRDRTRLEP
jgi:hypothetical protein